MISWLLRLLGFRYEAQGFDGYYWAWEGYWTPFGCLIHIKLRETERGYSFAPTKQRGKAG